MWYYLLNKILIRINVLIIFANSKFQHFYTTMGFAEYKKLDLVEINESVLKKWKEENCFENTLKAREGAPKFIFFEGPPSANGMPGIHHVMARAIKDSFCRFKTQSGYLVQRKAGWDTHGLPVELGVEKALGITKEDIGRDAFLERAWDWKANFGGRIISQLF